SLSASPRKRNVPACGTLSARVVGRGPRSRQRTAKSARCARCSRTTAYPGSGRSARGCWPHSTWCCSCGSGGCLIPQGFRREAGSRDCYYVVLGLTLPALAGLLMFVVDSTLLSYRFVMALSGQRERSWPAQLLADSAKKWELEERVVEGQEEVKEV